MHGPSIRKAKKHMEMTDTCRSRQNVGSISRNNNTGAKRREAAHQCVSVTGAKFAASARNTSGDRRSRSVSAGIGNFAIAEGRGRGRRHPRSRSVFDSEDLRHLACFLFWFIFSRYQAPEVSALPPSRRLPSGPLSFSPSFAATSTLDLFLSSLS